MRHLFYISFLSLALAACSSDGGDDVRIEVSDMPISLDVASLLSKTESRASIKGITDGGKWQTGDQFIVNALYYHSVTTTLGQQYMHNDLVTATVTTNSWNNSTTTKWSYAPLKYWPQQGYVDFFAAYPKDYVDNNMDRQRLFHENLGDTVIMTRFYLDKPGKHDNKKAIDAIEQWDLMFSHRPHLSKPDVTTPVKFTFTHAEMAIRFWAGNLDLGNNSVCIIDSISLDNIHTGGLITALDITDWQSYYAQFASQEVITSTAGATTPVKLEYTWDWTSDPIMHPDIRGTYTQDMSFNWSSATTSPPTLINPGNKVFIIPPQCIGSPDGSSITIYYRTHDAGGVETLRTHTITQEFCGKPGTVLDLVLSTTVPGTEATYPIEVITATLTPWEDIAGGMTTDLEK